MAKKELQVLKALDGAKTQLYHFTAIAIAGMGFFTDAYDLFSISLVTKLLGRIYYYKENSDKPGVLPPLEESAVNVVALVGTVVGQLFFGFLGDKMGRKKAYGITLILMVFCSIASGLSMGKSPKEVISTLCFFRFWLGFGIGGEYPLSATLMSEYANIKTRGAFISAVFAMQGCGILAAGIVALIVSYSFNVSFKDRPYDHFGSTVTRAGYVWRIILMFGALPAAFTYYWRMQMPETARYTALVAKDYPRAYQDARKVLKLEFEPEEDEEVSNEEISSTTYGLFSKDFLRRHGLHLLGTTTTWFFLDIAFYSQNLFQKDIFTSIGWIPQPEEMNAIQEVFQIAQAQTLIALFGTIPGYCFTVGLIDIIGRFTIQVMGFFFMTVFMFALAIPYHYWNNKNHIGFVVMYSLTFFFANFGPNVTTFVIPAEIFPARMRSTCHGISAAAGKIGAIVGALGFLYASKPAEKNDTDNSDYPPGIGVRYTLIMLGCTNFLGMLFSSFVPETKGKSLEELSGENDRDGPKYDPGDYHQQPSTSDQHAPLRDNISTRMWSPTSSYKI